MLNFKNILGKDMNVHQCWQFLFFKKYVTQKVQFLLHFGQYDGFMLGCFELFPVGFLAGSHEKAASEPSLASLHMDLTDLVCLLFVADKSDIRFSLIRYIML